MSESVNPDVILGAKSYPTPRSGPVTPMLDTERPKGEPSKYVKMDTSLAYGGKHGDQDKMSMINPPPSSLLSPDTHAHVQVGKHVLVVPKSFLTIPGNEEFFGHAYEMLKEQ